MFPLSHFKIWFVLLLAFVCGSVSPSQASVPTILSPRLRVLGQSSSSSGVHTFAAARIFAVAPSSVTLDAATASSLSPGDVITNSAGRGLLRKVVSVHRSISGEAVVDTTQGTLLDVFQQADIKVTKKLGASSFDHVETKMPGLSYRGPTSKLAVGGRITHAAGSFDLPGLAFDFQNLSLPGQIEANGLGGDLKVNGSINVQPTLEIEIRIRAFPPRVDYCMFQVKTTSTFDLHLAAQVHATFLDFKKLYAVASGPPILVPVGPVTIPVTPTLGLYFKVEGSASDGFTCDLSLGHQSGGGLRYDPDNGVQPLHVNSRNWAGCNIYGNASLTLSCTPAHAEFAFYIFSLRGPYLYANLPEFTATVDVGSDSSNPNKVQWKITAAITGGAAFDLEILGLDVSYKTPDFTFASVTVDQSDYDRLTRPTPTPPPSPTPRPISNLTITPSTATVYAGSYKQFSVAATDANNQYISLPAADVNWSSLDTSIATVDAQGRAKGIKPGLGTIYATDPKSGTRAYATLTVTNAPSVVTNSNSEGNGSLNAAITYANLFPGTTITFNIPRSDPAFSQGVFSISTSTSIEADTILDGATQTAFSGDTNANGPELTVNGITINVGSITFKGGIFNYAGSTRADSSTTLNPDATATLNWTQGTAQGTVNLASNSALTWTGGTLAGVLTVPAGGVLTLSPYYSGTYGTYGTTWINGGTLINNGTVKQTRDNAGALAFFDAGGTITNGGTWTQSNSAITQTLNINTTKGFALFTNTGTFNSNNDSGANCSFTNTGTVNATGQASISTLKQTAGRLLLSNATLSGSLSLLGGEVSGTGTLNGTILNSGSIFKPGGSSVGTLNINGDYTHSGKGALEIGWASAKSGDVLAVSGTARLGGNVTFAALGKYVPLTTDRFVVLTGKSVVSKFASVTTTTFPNGTALAPTYNATNVELSILGSGSFKITGHVFRWGEGGIKPGLSKVPVTAVDGKGRKFTATTDAVGYYSLQKLGAGTYTVSPTLKDTTFVPLSQTVTLPTSKLSASPDATLDFATYAISGSVKVGTKGILGATVTLVKDGSTLATFKTDASGAFRFQGLGLGVYSVSVSAPKVTFTTPTQKATLPTTNKSYSPNVVLSFVGKAATTHSLGASPSPTDPQPSTPNQSQGSPDPFSPSAGNS